MPTGYTASVADGTVSDLKTFALTLARGMGALVMMRDMPSDTPIPDEFEPSNHYAEKLEEFEAERIRITNMTEAQCELEVQKLTDEYYEAEAKAEEKWTKTRQNYLNMIEKVEAWTGAPEGIKEFALSQLNQSMDFDCRDEFKYYGTLPDADPENWRETQLAKIARDSSFYHEHNVAERKRVAERNAWIKQLKESLND